MKPRSPRPRPAPPPRCRLLAWLVAVICCLHSVPAAPPPAWWAARRVLNGQPADDYAVANAGQLKAIAYKASLEVLAKRGALDDSIESMMENWQGTGDDFRVVTVGEVKSVAKKFYEQLGLPVPWSSAHGMADDYAVANIGQVKTAFSFPILNSLRFTTLMLPGGVVGTEYNTTVQVAGGVPPYTFSIKTGVLPAPLSLASTSGSISGTPATAGTTSFTLKVTDAAGMAVSKSFTLTTSPAGTTPPGGPVLVRHLPRQPPSRYKIPATIFAEAAARWAALPVLPAGSTEEDFDGDGIPNDEEYRLSLQDPASFPPSRAMLDPNDLDGDGLPQGTDLNDLDFADAVADADADRLLNFDELMSLASFSARHNNARSIVQNHVTGTTLIYQKDDQGQLVLDEQGNPVVIGSTPVKLPSTCPLLDGELVFWQRNIDLRGASAFNYPGEGLALKSWTDTNEGMAGSTPDGLPDGLQKSFPSAYSLGFPTAASGFPTYALGGDQDLDGMPDAWEHRHRLLFHNPKNAGTANQREKAPTVQQYPFAPWKYESAMAAYLLRDPDQDSLPNILEFTLGSNPRLADTDGDGFTDAFEHTFGANPASYTHTPESIPLVMHIAGGNYQTISAGSLPGDTLIVRLTRNNLPYPGAQVTFASSTLLLGEGMTPASTTTSDSDGYAAVLPFGAETLPYHSTAHVTATSSGVSVQFKLTATNPFVTPQPSTSGGYSTSTGGQGTGGQTTGGQGSGTSSSDLRLVVSRQAMKASFSPPADTTKKKKPEEAKPFRFEAFRKDLNGKRFIEKKGTSDQTETAYNDFGRAAFDKQSLVGEFDPAELGTAAEMEKWRSATGITIERKHDPAHTVTPGVFFSPPESGVRLVYDEDLEEWIEVAVEVPPLIMTDEEREEAKKPVPVPDRHSTRGSSVEVKLEGGKEGASAGFLYRVYETVYEDGRKPALPLPEDKVKFSAYVTLIKGKTTQMPPEINESQEFKNCIIPGPSKATFLTKLPAIQKGTTDPTTKKTISRTVLRHATLLPIDLAIDADRNGTITSGESATQDKPFKFWLNDDHDIEHSVDMDGITAGIGQEDIFDGNKDGDDSQIKCARDLEDFTRLHMDVSALIQQLKSGEMSAGLSFTETTGSPSIKVFRAQDQSGRMSYLTIPTASQAQIAEAKYNTSLGTVTASSQFKLPQDFWADSTGKTHFIFEAVGEGKGKLQITLYKGSQSMGNGASVWMDLLPIKKMYQRWNAGEVTESGVQWDFWPKRTAEQDSDSSEPSGNPTADDEKDFVLFVHGWNMTKEEKRSFAETAYKRLWQIGYKGRFGSFFWPTFYATSIPEKINPRNFDGSEHRAWESSDALLGLMTQLNQKYPGRLHVIAHSMGNVVTSEALHKASGIVAKNYVSSQAALAADVFKLNPDITSTWDGVLQQTFNVNGISMPGTKPVSTPNVYAYYYANGRDEAYRRQQYPEMGAPFMNGVGGAAKWHNFLNPHDWALGAWIYNQSQKPNGAPINGEWYQYGHGFLGNIWGFKKLSGMILQDQRELFTPEDNYEIFCYCAQARSNATGRQSGVGGPFAVADQVNWAEFDDKHPGHSAQFLYSIARRWKYWEKVLRSCDIQHMPWNILSQRDE